MIALFPKSKIYQAFYSEVTPIIGQQNKYYFFFFIRSLDGKATSQG